MMTMDTDHSTIMAQWRAAHRTTRGTPRPWAPEGLWPGIRYQILATKPPGLVEDLLQGKLPMMSAARRRGVQAALDGLTGQERREFALGAPSGGVVARSLPETGP